MSLSPELELQEKVAEWRRKTADDSMTMEEYQKAIEHLRMGRHAASAAAAKAGKGAKKPPVNTDNLLDQLKGL